MTDQPQEEWDKMTQQQQNEILAGVRLAAIVADAERAEYRGRLIRASRPSARAIEALHRIPGL